MKRTHRSQPDEALARVRKLHEQAAADYAAAHAPSTRAAARAQLADARVHGAESARACIAH